MDEKTWYLNKDPERGGWLYEVVDLREPDRVRYVGKTQVSVRERSAGHWYDARRVPRRTNSRMVNWLLKRNEAPETVQFRPHSFHETLELLNQAERDLITLYRERGMCDLNIGDGGEGKAGVKWTAEVRAKMQEAQRSGEDHPNATTTWSTVKALRASALKEYTPRKELAERFGMTLSNMDKILWNQSWVDPDYDPTLRKPRVPPRGFINPNSSLSWGIVREIRERRQRVWESHEAVASAYGLKKSAVGYILSNKTWQDPDFDPSTIKKRGSE